jgi:CRP-like cAMP-binding protein
MNFVQTLRETFVFKSMPEAELKKLAGLAAEERLGGQASVFSEGEAGDDMYVIALGSVRVLKKNREGVEEEIATLGTGSYFGEMALVADEHERTASIVASEPTTLLVVRRQAIEALCAKDNVFAHHFYRAVARGLTRRLRATSTDAAYYKTLMKQHHRS